jgi:hypothetical protein
VELEEVVRDLEIEDTKKAPRSGHPDAERSAA